MFYFYFFQVFRMVVGKPIVGFKLNFSFLQGWRIRGFEGERAPPRRQKHPLEISEKLHKTLRNTKIQQKYDDLRSNQGKSIITTAKIRR